MFGSVILDVAVGMILTYLLLSLVASAIREGFEGWLKMRATHLERALQEFIGDPVLLKTLYENPHIASLYRGDYSAAKLARDLPSYIPSRNFALALMDMAIRGRSATTSASTDTPPLTVQNLRTLVGRLGNRRIQQMMLSALDTADGDLGKVQANIEASFNASMERASGWYKRETQKIIFVTGLVIAVAADVDSVNLANELYRDPGVRASAVAMAGDIGKSTTPGDDRTAREAIQSLSEIKLIAPWAGVTLTTRGILGHAGTSFIGWLVTAFAISLGAPFWFDTLKRVMTIRSSVKPPDPAPTPRPADPPASQQNLVVSTPSATTPATASVVMVAPVTAAIPAATATPDGYEPQQWKSGRPDGGVI